MSRQASRSAPTDKDFSASSIKPDPMLDVTSPDARTRAFAFGGTRAGVATRFVASIVLLQLSGVIVNGTVYPELAGFFGIGREISTLMTALAFLLLGVLATRRPSHIDARRFSQIALVMAAVVVPLLGFAVSSQSILLVLAGMLLRSVSSAWAIVVFAIAVLRFSDARIVVVLVGIGVAASSLGFSAAPAFQSGPYVASCALALTAAIPIILLYPDSEPYFTRIRQASIASALGVDTFGGTRSVAGLLLCMLLIGVATGFGLTFNEVNDSPLVTVSDSLVLSLIIVGAVVLETFKKTGTVRPRRSVDDALFTMVVLFVLAGCLIAPLAFGRDATTPNILLRVGHDVFTMLTWLVIYSIGRRNVFAALPVLAGVRIAAGVGITFGAAGGHWVNGVLASDPFIAQAAVAAFIMAFVAFLWIGFRDFSFGRAIEGIEEVEDAGIERMGGYLDERCEVLARAYGLTTRELEILGQLARGRDGKFIEQELVLSYNTVKTHIKHIYQKLGVHSRQELLDLIEGKGGRGGVKA